MGFSENLRCFRIQKNLTQEQLARRLGVSTQAVSKWEGDGAYPDGALLVPLAAELEVSLDELFDYRRWSMERLSWGIQQLLSETGEDEKFQRALELCWQIEKGLYNPGNKAHSYVPDEGKRSNPSYILKDSGFSMASYQLEPFFAIFPEPEEGYGASFENEEELQRVFQALASPATHKALFYLCQRPKRFTFESGFLAKTCEIPEKEIEAVVADLETLCVVESRELTINGQKTTLYTSRSGHKVLALLRLAQELSYSGPYSWQSYGRSRALVPECKC